MVMPINHLHLTLQRLLLQLRPGERITRIRNWSRLLVGLCLSRSVRLSKIASKIPTTNSTTTGATLPSATRRLSRLLDNAAIRVRDRYEPIAHSLLERAAAKGRGKIRLVVDGSKVGFKHRLLMVSLAYRKRASRWLGAGSGARRATQLFLQATSAFGLRKGSLMPDGAAAAARVSVVGDSEFGAVETLKQLEEWGFYHVMRQKSSHLWCVRSPSSPSSSGGPWGS